jgi:rhodanese-related sulfurtransferase
MKYILYGVVVIIIAWVAYKQFMPVKGLTTINAEQFAKAHQGNLLIDVREVHEYKQGHLANSVNIPLSVLKERLADIPKDRPVFLYCRSGMRSKQAAGILLDHGYKDLTHMNGGILGWNGAVIK